MLGNSIVEQHPTGRNNVGVLGKSMQSASK